MDNEQITQEIRDLNDTADTLMMQVQDNRERLAALEASPCSAPSSAVADRLAGHDRMLALYAAELAVLAEIVDRLAKSLPVGMNDGA